MGETSLRNRISYGFAEFGSQFSWSLISSYLLVYFSDILEFNPATISIIMLTARLIDTIDDPIIGMITERTESKNGRFRPYLLYISPLLALFNILTFTSFGSNMTTKAIMSGIFYIFCGICYSFISISVGSLGTVMSPNREDRVKLNFWRTIGGNVSSLIISATTMPLLLYFGNRGVVSQKSYFVVALLFSAVSFISIWISFLGTKEQMTLPKNHQKISFVKGFKIAITDFNTIILIIAMTLFLTGIFGRLSLMVYYYIYVLEDVSMVAIVSSVLSFSMMIPAFFLPSLIKKIDIKKCMSFSAFLCSIACILMYFFGRKNGVVVYIGTFLLGVGNWIGFCSGPMVAEIIDDIQVKKIVRIDGTVYSCISFASKLGNTLGASLGILLLSSVGYKANSVQPEVVKAGMNGVINLLPAFLFLGAAVFFYFIKLTNKKGEANTKIIKKIFGF